eukprot:3210951-Prymnesium_polylepis.1
MAQNAHPRANWAGAAPSAYCGRPAPIRRTSFHPRALNRLSAGPSWHTWTTIRVPNTLCAKLVRHPS